MKTKFQLSTITVACLTAIFSSNALSSFIRTDINYQTYRDFAENKGQFAVGVQNVQIYNKQGQSLGTMLNNIPMIDFSSADRNNGVATAVSPQYIASVTHNTGYGSVTFGNQGTNPDAHHFNYLIVNRNNKDASWGGNTDYHLPRVHKLITEIVPASMSDIGDGVEAYLDKSRFPLFLRVGSGVQKTRATDGTLTDITGSYQSLLGGAPLDITFANRKTDTMHVQSDLYNSNYAPLTTYATPGDSGSPIYGYDTQQKRWVMVGVVSTYAGNAGQFNSIVLNRPDYLKHLQNSAIGANISNATHNGIYTWTANGNTSTIKSPKGENFQVDLADTSLQTSDINTARPSLDHGKDLKIEGYKSVLQLKNNINQGAGALYINAGVTVRSDNDSTWQGAGVVVEKGKRVDWQVKNPQGDRLSKLGEGEFWVNGSGVNQGDISVGDGLVVLAQKADQHGKQQAFNSVGIVSGRPTVRLDANNQVNPNNIYFGYRGGRLDLNGHSLTFNHIQNVDDGARIVNNNAGASASIEITGRPDFTEKDIQWGQWRESGKDLYEYINPHQRKRTDYFVLRNNPNDFYPTNGTSSASWEYLSSDRNKAIQIVLERKNALQRTMTFSGYLGETNSSKTNGKLNVTFNPTDRKHRLMLNGGTNLNGDLTANNGTLLLSGAATQHAYDKLSNQDVFYENDWINRSFTANRLVANNDATIEVGRNVTALNANIEANHRARLHLGFEQGKSLNCVYSGYSGATTCTEQAVLQAQNFANLPVTQINGNAILNGNSTLELGKAHLRGHIQGAIGSHVRLSSNAVWTNSADSTLGNLALEQGAVVNLNSNYENGTPTRFNNLLINGNLTGAGRFNYLTNVADGKGDHITVKGKADGVFVLALKNSGKEPTKSNPLSLLTLNASKANNAQVTLANGYVDLGAYRYVLANQNQDYRLFSPLKAMEEQKNGNPQNNTMSHITVQQALANAEKHHQAVTALGNQIAIQQKASQSAKAELAAAQARLQQAKQELAKLRRINFIKRARLNREINHLNNRIVAAQNAINNNEHILKNIAVALSHAQSLATQADQVLAIAQSSAPVSSNSKPTAQSLCLDAGASSESCLLFASGEGFEGMLDSFEQRDWISQYANVALTELSAQANSALHLGQTLDRQLFEHSDKLRVWANVDWQKTKHESNLYRPYKQTSTLNQIGVETPLTNGISLGFVASQERAKNDFDEYLNGKGNLDTATLYGKYRANFGTFITLDASAGRAKNHIDLSKFHRNFSAFGLNIGHEFDVHGVKVQPSVGMRHYRFGSANYELFEAQIHTPAQHFNAYQAGVRMAKTFLGENWNIEPNLSVYYVDASQHHTEVTINDVSFQQRFDRHLRGETGINLHYRNWQFGANIGLMSGNEIQRQYFSDAKLGYSW